MITPIGWAVEIWTRLSRTCRGAAYSRLSRTDAPSVRGRCRVVVMAVSSISEERKVFPVKSGSQNMAHILLGEPLVKMSDKLGASQSWLGFPTSGEQGLGNLWVKQNFEGGYILWHPGLWQPTVFTTVKLLTLCLQSRVVMVVQVNGQLNSGIIETCPVILLRISNRASWRITL